MEYKLLPGPNKMLPKVFFAPSNNDKFAPSDELLKNYELGKHKKGNDFDLEFCHELIDFFKTSIEKHEDWKKFNFRFSDTKSYSDISEFYKEVEAQGYKVTFKNISSSYIDELVEQNKLYLFQIYNKDFSENKKSKGKDNLHTLYWKALFDENNSNNVVYKLDGNAEIFYRKASLPLTITHPKNLPLENKNKNNIKKYSEFAYDLIKDKRYTEDKFHFHVPVKMNFINKAQSNINEIVNKGIKALDNIYVIGIDRGERNLLYISLIDSNGNIIEQYSLNEIINEYNGQTYITDYHKLLDERESEREESRKNWTTIENIKELKEGYISQVIHKIVRLMEKYNAIIVLEDLNKGFKNSRIKVEKQVYQKFEKMLIEKLNYLVIKGNKGLDEGGVFNSYQLTSKFESFEKMSKQSGILFYIPAWNTSKIDSTTGFVNLLNVKYESIEESKKFFNKFDEIKYNENGNYFEFYLDYTKFTDKAFGLKKDWILCTNYKRIKTFRNKEKNGNWDTQEVVLVDEFKKLFNKYEIDINNLKGDIIKQNSKEFFESLIYLVKLMLQMRNSIPNSPIDYLVSPVKNSTGEFFITNETAIIKDADANGAYNIARKGLMIIEQIKEADDDKLSKIKFDISNKAWLEFVQGFGEKKWKS